MNFSIKKIAIYNLFGLMNIAKILKDCGDDMFEKYQLSHWKNSYLKTFLIVVYTALKHTVYGIYDRDNRMIATIQTKVMEDFLHLSKLAVSPKTSGKGIGSYCMQKMEHMAKDMGLSALKCEVYDKSKYAYDFYLKRGFVVVGQMNTLKYTELILEKRL